MSDQFKDANWTINEGAKPNVQDGMLFLLQDIRRELKALNRLLNCANAIEIPYTLREIRSNTAKPARKKRKPR